MKTRSVSKTWFAVGLSAVLFATLLSITAVARDMRLRTNLTGAPINGVTPNGKAEFRSRPNRTEFKTEVEHVNLDAGTVLTVSVDGTAVGTLTLDSTHEGELELESEDGDTVPDVHVGSTVVVTDATGATIVAGVF
jgi:hypothetical protein